MISGATSYQDAAFARPKTPKQRRELLLEEVPLWGGLAFVDVEATYHFDGGALTLDDLSLEGFEITGFRGDEDAWFRWEAREISRWRQRRISEILSAVEQRVADLLTQ